VLSLSLEEINVADDDGIENRLNILIYLYLDQKFPRVAEKIFKLSELSLNSGEIAAIVGKPANYVAATLSRSKGKAKKGTAHG
jgi:hypothetical protein